MSGSVCVRLLNIGDASVIFCAIIVDGVVVVLVREPVIYVLAEFVR